MFNSTKPSSTVVTLGDRAHVNTNDETYIMYSFAPKKGFSKFGSYTGNNNANGNFIYTGFRPAWVMIKDKSSGQSWHIADHLRDTGNPRIGDLAANDAWSESTTTTNRGSTPIDFLSNGFKIRSDTSGINGTGNHIYFAFAEFPFVSSSGTPITAG